MTTATDILPDIRTALRADANFSAAIVPTIVIGHSGTFDFNSLPRPAIVLAPLNERNPFPPVTRNGQKLIQIVAYVYTDFFGQEIGMLGDAYTVGVMPLADQLEAFLDDNLLAGLVVQANVSGKDYPLPADMTYDAIDVGMNEVRVSIVYQTLTV